MSKKKSQKNRSEFGKALVVARLKMGVIHGREFTLGEIAKMLGITPAFLSALEYGHKVPNIKMVTKILDVYPIQCKQDLKDALFV